MSEWTPDHGKEVRRMMDEMAKGDEEVAQWVNRSKTVSSLARIPGDASTRRYYRMGVGRDSYIVMRADPFAEHGAQGERYPFLVVQRHLAAAGIDVPRVIDVDAERGFIVLEDLGDDTLLRRLQDVASADVERHLYQRVLDSLVRLHYEASPGRARAAEGMESGPYRLRFDQEKLMWEVNFTIEHFYQLHLKRDIPEADLRVVRETFGEICRALADEPTVLTHRDFHSRNVMACPGRPPSGASSVDAAPEDRLVMIDFQDARMGPAQYDLASLLKDSYYQLEDQQVSRLLDYYLARWEGVSGQQLDRDHFLRMFDLMSVQRNFKAIGSFASFLNRRGIPTYLKYIGNTFENIRRTLLKYPEYARLREVLFHYYYF